MKIKLNSILKPTPNDLTLSEFEEDWYLELPKYYKAFLKKFNGAIIENGTFFYKSAEYPIDRFLGMVEDFETTDFTCYDIRVIGTNICERLAASNEGLVSLNMVPIAVLFAGDFICLDYRETSDAPTVCILFHEETGQFGPVTETIANSFTEFLKMLSE